MFASRAHAEASIAEIVPEELHEGVLALLTPAIGFRPADEDRAGGTRLGGVPDVGPGFSWPRLELTEAERAALPADVASIPGVTLDAGHSLCFMAQIDLGELGGLGGVDKQLPPHGRLLIFWDQLIGCWNTGTGATRVIWDETPADQCTPAELPEDLRAKHDADGREQTSFYAPARPASLYASVMLPSLYSDVMETRDALEELQQLDDTEALDELTNVDGEFCPGTWCAIQLLGLPQPVQNDPRHSLNVDDPEAWQLLFQLPLSDWDPEYGEGRMYALIHRDDLAARDFSRVRTEYQQT